MSDQLRRVCKNVLFITADQLRADVLYFSDMALAPNIRALRQEGIAFLRHFAQSAPCGPSRASLHTSTFAHRNGVLQNGTCLPDDLPNWARVLRTAGFDPCLVGFTHTAIDPGRNDPSQPMRRQKFEGILPGLRVCQEFRADMTDWYEWIPVQVREEIGSAASLLVPRGSSSEAPRPACGVARYSREHSDLSFLTQKAIEFVESKAGQEWVLHLSLFRPHDPYLIPDDMPLVEASVWSESARDMSECDCSSAAVNAHCLAKLAKPSLELDILIRRHYETLVIELDGQIGRLIGALKALGIYDDTAIVLTADHGDQLGDYGLYGKGGFWQQSYHVPLVCRVPGADGIGDAHVVDEMTENVDVAPTILGILGCRSPTSFQGRQIPGLTSGSRVPWRKKYAHWESYVPGLPGQHVKVVRSDRFLAAAVDTRPCEVFGMDRYGTPLMRPLGREQRESAEAEELMAHINAWGATG